MSDLYRLINELVSKIDLDENIRPARDRVLVQELKERASEIIHTPLDNERANKGVVVATGPGKYSKTGKLIPTGVKPGQVVLFNKHVGENVEINGKKGRMIKAADLMAVIN